MDENQKLDLILKHLIDYNEGEFMRVLFLDGIENHELPLLLEKIVEDGYAKSEMKTPEGINENYPKEAHYRVTKAGLDFSKLHLIKKRSSQNGGLNSGQRLINSVERLI
ncbi:MAG: hypothetical protein WDO19_24820 [Bacteroidota bacterium]